MGYFFITSSCSLTKRAELKVMICIYDCQHGRHSCGECQAKERRKYCEGKYSQRAIKTLLLTGRNQPEAREYLKRSVDLMDFMTEKEYQARFWNQDRTLKE